MGHYGKDIFSILILMCIIVLLRVRIKDTILEKYGWFSIVYFDKLKKAVLSVVGSSR